MGNGQLLWLVLLGTILIFGLLVFFLWLSFFRYWIRAVMSGAPVSMLSILAMRLRGNPPSLLIDAYSRLRRDGVNATIADVEIAYMDSKTRVHSGRDLVAFVQDKIAR
jgi:uncharacterized protein YqfA (UPF0365 family)